MVRYLRLDINHIHDSVALKVGYLVDVDRLTKLMEGSLGGTSGP